MRRRTRWTLVLGCIAAGCLLAGGFLYLTPSPQSSSASLFPAEWSQTLPGALAREASNNGSIYLLLRGVGSYPGVSRPNEVVGYELTHESAQTGQSEWATKFGLINPYPEYAPTLYFWSGEIILFLAGATLEEPGQNWTGVTTESVFLVALSESNGTILRSEVLPIGGGELTSAVGDGTVVYTDLDPYPLTDCRMFALPLAGLHNGPGTGLWTRADNCMVPDTTVNWVGVQDGAVVASNLDPGNNVSVYDLTNGALVRTWKMPQDATSATQDGGSLVMLVSNTSGSSILEINCTTGAWVRSFPVEANGNEDYLIALPGAVFLSNLTSLGGSEYPLVGGSATSVDFPGIPPHSAPCDQAVPHYLSGPFDLAGTALFSAWIPTPPTPSAGYNWEAFEVTSVTTGARLWQQNYSFYAPPTAAGCTYVAGFSSASPVYTPIDAVGSSIVLLSASTILVTSFSQFVSA
jgi:hypothetical protein